MLDADALWSRMHVLAAEHAGARREPIRCDERDVAELYSRTFAPRGADGLRDKTSGVVMGTLFAFRRRMNTTHTPIASLFAVAIVLTACGGGGGAEPATPTTAGTTTMGNGGDQVSRGAKLFAGPLPTVIPHLPRPARPQRARRR